MPVYMSLPGQHNCASPTPGRSCSKGSWGSKLVDDGVAADRATNPGNKASDPTEKLLQECGVQLTRVPSLLWPAASSSTWPEGSLEPVAKAIADLWLKKCVEIEGEEKCSYGRFCGS